MGAESCSITNFTVPRRGAGDSRRVLTAALGDLAQRGISPDTLHLEPRNDRFATLTACSPAQIRLFDQSTDALAARLNDLSAAQIAARLQTLYDKAYRYDPKKKTMGVVDQVAKRELDLWIAAIDHRAYQDEAFLKKVKIPRIELILTLNSPDLLETGRGEFYQVQHRLIKAEDLIREGFMAELADCDRYTGESFKTYWDRPEVRSGENLGRALKILWGKEKFRELEARYFPVKEAEAFFDSHGMGQDYRSLKGFSDDELTKGAQNGILAISGTEDPAARKNLFGIMYAISFEMNLRGMDEEEAIHEFEVAMAMVLKGASREDAELIVGPDGVGESPSRLDNYEWRYRYLRKFAENYAAWLGTPLEERFTPENLQNQDVWANVILNQSSSKVSIALADLEKVRADVRRRFPEKPLSPVTWQDVEEVSLGRPIEIRPEEMPLPSAGHVGAVEVASAIVTENGTSLYDFIKGDVDSIVILPDYNFPFDNAAGTAASLYGTVLLREGEATTPGNFLHTIAHEAAHNYWFSQNFDSHPERLAWLAPNERWAYLFGGRVLAEYSGQVAEDSLEAGLISSLIDWDSQVVAEANHNLGLDQADAELKMTTPAWERVHSLGEDALLNFDPAEVWSAKQRIDRDWLDLAGMVIQDGKFTEIEIEQIGRVVQSLEDPTSNQPQAEGDYPVCLTPDDPFVRFYEGVSEVAGLEEPLEDLWTGSNWQDFKQAAVSRL